MKIHLSRSIRKICYVLIIVFQLGFLFSCTQEYHDHFFSRTGSGFIYSGSIQTSAVDNIYVLPDTSLKTKILSHIQDATSHIYLQIYIITDTDILDALVRARERGIDVRVILEGNPYMTPYVNNTAIGLLKKGGIPYIFSDSDRFNFTHAKMLLIDHIYMISTGNFTKTFFEKNRDFLIMGSDYQLYSQLEELFLADYSRTVFYPNSGILQGLVLSPINARESIESIIRESTLSIDIYAQSVTDSHILELVGEKKKQGIDASLCVGDLKSNEAISAVYERHNIPYTQASPYYLHGKIIFIDQKYIFLGSQNITQNALDGNREIGLIFEPTPGEFRRIFLIFQRDCQFRKGK